MEYLSYTESANWKGTTPMALTETQTKLAKFLAKTDAPGWVVKKFLATFDLSDMDTAHFLLESMAHSVVAASVAEALCKEAENSPVGLLVMQRGDFEKLCDSYRAEMHKFLDAGGMDVEDVLASASLTPKGMPPLPEGMFTKH